MSASKHCGAVSSHELPKFWSDGEGGEDGEEAAQAVGSVIEDDDQCVNLDTDFDGTSSAGVGGRNLASMIVLPPDDLDYSALHPRKLDPMASFDPRPENTPGTRGIADDATLLEIFLAVYGDAMNLAFEQTVRQSEVKYPLRTKDKPISMDEFVAFVAIIIHMSMVQMKNLRNYWDVNLFGSSFISNLMNRNRLMVFINEHH